MHSRVLLYTGGLDSTCAWHLLGKPQRLYVRIDPRLPHYLVGREVFPEDVILKDSAWVPPGNAQPDGHVALRNLHLVTVGALYADRVILGAVKGESSPDKSDAFLRAASHACTEASQGRKIKIEAPLKHLTKRQLVGRLLTVLGEQEARRVISLTRSCYSQDTERCGCCMACFRRWVALSLNGIHEVYASPPWLWEAPGWRERIRYIRQAPFTEWPGILETNAEAALALRRAADASSSTLEF